jgi:hypothetical protein
MLIIILFIGCFLMNETEKVDEISDLRWEYRIVLGVVENQDELTNCLETFENDKEEIEDRKIVYFITDRQGHHTNYQGVWDENIWKDVARMMDESDDPFALIGLDGGVKARYDKLNMSEIFSLIDTMPMRQQEMQKQKNN